MVDKKIGLGRGLTSLLGENLSESILEIEKNKNNIEIKKIPIEKIKPGPWQARKQFDKESIYELSESITSKGVINPIIITPTDGAKATEFYLIAGERRWRASQVAKIHEIPSIILNNINEENASEISIIENVQRKDLNPIEEANGFNELLTKYKFTQEKVSKIIGKSRVYITNSLRLLKLPKKILNFIEEKKLSSGHARLLIGREDALDIANLIINKHLSVRQVEQLLRKKVSKKTTFKTEGLEVDSLSKKLSNALGLKVKIDYEANTKKSKTSIFCSTLDQLNDLIEKLEKTTKWMEKANKIK